MQLLEKYGTPPKFIAAVQTMYTDNVVVLKIEKEIEEFTQGVGVCQGDNMAPILFLFLMTAFAETLEIKWQKQNIKVCTAMMSGDEHISRGQLSSHTPKMFSSKLLTAYKIFQCLYVDDGAFPFDSRKSLTKGMNLVFHHFAKFGLKMHIGRNGGESKTECVFFPPPQFFCKWPLPSTDDNRGQTRSMMQPDPNAESLLVPKDDDDKPDDEQRENEGKLYHNLDETKDILVADGYITFTHSFKYLGSFISFNLRNDNNVAARIAAANASMGALKEIWCNPHLDTYSKYLLFQAISMNLLLWGCETWSLQQTLLNKLKVFMHCSIRRILDITMTQVKDDRIQNNKV